MKYMMKIKFPVERGNEEIANAQFGEKMHSLLAEIRAEAVYFTTICGQRGAYIVVNINDASEIPAISEPFFLWLNAEIDWVPVMTPEDLAKAGPAIGAAAAKWS
jgi:hypothetical protein